MDTTNNSTRISHASRARKIQQPTFPALRLSTENVLETPSSRIPSILRLGRIRRECVSATAVILAPRARQVAHRRRHVLRFAVVILAALARRLPPVQVRFKAFATIKLASANVEKASPAPIARRPRAPSVPRTEKSAPATESATPRTRRVRVSPIRSQVECGTALRARCVTRIIREARVMDAERNVRGQRISSRWTARPRSAVAAARASSRETAPAHSTRRCTAADRVRTQLPIASPARAAPTEKIVNPPARASTEQRATTVETETEAAPTAKSDMSVNSAKSPALDRLPVFPSALVTDPVRTSMDPALVSQITRGSTARVPATATTSR